MRFLRLFLVLALLLPAPSVAGAASAVVRVKFTPRSTTAQAWSASLSGLDASLSLTGGAQSLQRILSHERLDLALGAPAPTFAAMLGMTPQELAALPPVEQAKLVEAAVAARTEELANLPADSEEVAKSWYYLEGEEGKAANNAWFELDIKARKKAPILSRLRGFFKHDSLFGRETDAALSNIFDGAATISSDSGVPAASDLATYSRQALKRAEATLDERVGLAIGNQLSERILSDHEAVFGRVAPRSLFKRLRQAGSWDEFVATLSLTAAETLETSSDAVNLLKEAGTRTFMRLPIPAWHPAAGEQATVADWLKARHGAPEAPKPGGWRLGRFFGVPVHLQYSFLILPLLLGPKLAMQYAADGAGLAFGVANAILFFGGMIFSIVAHEFGHILVGRRYGAPTTHVEVGMLGGVASMDEIPVARQELLMALAGPAVSVVLALVFQALSGAIALPVLAGLGLFNVVMAVFNLVFPAFPMDGGRVLRSVLAMVLGDHYAATRVAGVVARIAGAVMVAAALYLGAPTMLIIGLMLTVFAGRMSLHPGTKPLPLVGPKPLNPAEKAAVAAGLFSSVATPLAVLSSGAAFSLPFAVGFFAGAFIPVFLFAWLLISMFRGARRR
jgi:Zn-dependent protease